MTAAITPVILAYNEAPNLARTLDRLAWAHDIVVLDSFSTDDTVAIAARYPRVRVVQRAFTTQADQWNFALEQTGITTDWVLALDADYVLSDELQAELPTLDLDGTASGYEASFIYCIDGRPLRSGAYPPVTVLFRRGKSHVRQDGHAQRVRVDGRVDRLAGRIFHDDRKRLSHWLSAQSRYARLEAEKLERTPSADLAAIDRLRKWLVVMPPAMFIYCLVVRGGLLDGRAGLFYAIQRAVVEALLSLYRLDRILGHDRSPDQIS
jgi:glycosyltransferase involved in cell wall biosynthesis